jgi:hypothetical protein
MASATAAFLRKNAFLVAAVALPALVAALFLIASAIPQWTVPPPAYDLVLRVARPYDAARSRVTVEFAVRDGRVEATVRPAPDNAYVQSWALLLFDHETAAVQEIPLDELPASMADGVEARTIVLDVLAGRRVSAQPAAPDGYELRTGARGGTGLIGDVFGMGRYRQNTALVNRGRVVPLELPSPFQDPYQSAVHAIGWVLDEGR